MGYTSMSQFHTEWSHFSRQMVTIDYDGVSTKIDQCNGQRSLNELGAVTLILLHICSMISFGGFLEECLPCLIRIDPMVKVFIPYIYEMIWPP